MIYQFFYYLCNANEPRWRNGRRARFRCECREACRFDSYSGHIIRRLTSVDRFFVGGGGWLAPRAAETFDSYSGHIIRRLTSVDRFFVGGGGLVSTSRSRNVRLLFWAHYQTVDFGRPSFFVGGGGGRQAGRTARTASCRQRLKAAWSLATREVRMVFSVERIMFLIASGVDLPWPMVTGAFTPRTGVPPVRS